jgi:hypothetical protein
MGRKRRQMSKIFGYKEGHTPSHKGKNLDYEQNSGIIPDEPEVPWRKMLIRFGDNMRTKYLNNVYL